MTHHDGWILVDFNEWADAADTLTAAGLPWPRALAVADLRWWLGRLHRHEAKRIPSHRKLRARWGWTEWKTRALMRDEVAWKIHADECAP